MICPSCRREMQEILSDGMPIDFCTGCRGSFLDRGEEPAFSNQPAVLRKALDKGLQDATLAAFACPRCGGKMREGWLLERDFRIDRCDECKGLWFDSKELSRLKKLEPEPDPPPAARAKPAAARGGKAATSGELRCPSCRQPPRPSDLWQCRCGNQWHAIASGGVCPRCRRRWEELQCLRCAAWSHPAKWADRSGKR